MRLICPNCGAQYEVPAEVIPETGRDVQCSDCGTTWFQHHPDHPAAENIGPDEGIDTSEQEDAPDLAKPAIASSGSAVDYSAEDEDADDLEEARGDFPVEDETDAARDWEGFDGAPLDDAATAEEEVVGQDTSDAPSEAEAGTDDTDEDAKDGLEAPDDLEVTEEVEAQDADEHDGDDSEDDDQPIPDPPPRPPLDENITSVLREEAAREAQAREEERRSGLETQPDLGLTQHDSSLQQRTLEAEARMARLRGDNLDEPDNVAADIAATMAGNVAGKSDIDDTGIDPSSRSNLLPDIDEINSSLDSQAERSSGASEGTKAAQAETQSGGFRTGFRIALVITLIGVLLYVFAPQIAGNVPQLEAPLSAFSGAVDTVRSELDKIVDAIVASIEPSSEP